MKIKNFLHDNWQFALQTKIKNDQDIKYKKWYPAKVPGTVYHNLLINKLIPDPFYADNEIKLQWIAGSNWCYRTDFGIPKEFNHEDPVYLVFEGLDTAAEIYLNNTKLGSAENMFCTYKFEVSNHLNKHNVLEIFFTSPHAYAKELEKKYGQLQVALNSERVYVRKAQYSFGWDWGPSFADMGIWKSVFLLQEENSIQNFTFNTTSLTESSAKVELNITFSKELKIENRVLIKINHNETSYELYLPHTNERSLKETIEIENPKLWFPNGEGEQNLYNVEIILYRFDHTVDKLKKRVGIRTIDLKLKEDDKNTFYFVVNGRRIFAKGCNWIPADSFLTRVEDKKYFDLLKMAKNANMNFIRVWGGGFYENDKFYELCDEYGLLVWQDFMFACASYPEYEEFLLNVTEEVKQNISRLQYHPSLAIWCGNNENEWIWYQRQKRSYKEMPGYKIYSRLIPDIIKEIDPHRPYWESSPFSFDEDPNSITSGNRHQWDLWSRWVDYNKVKNDNSLFVTEFGFQGPANQNTFEKVIPKEERNPQSYLFEFHNKQVEGNERQFKFLAGHLPVKTSWEDFIYLAQLSQGLALKTCVEHWRYNYPVTNGTIIWQLNDCWPVSSWALIDSELKPKLSYYLVKESFKPQLVKFIHEKNKLDIILLNNSINNFNGYLELHEIKLHTGKTELIKKIKVKSTSIKSVLFSIRSDVLPGKSLIVATLYNESREIICRNIFNDAEWKHLKLPEANVKAKIKTDRIGRYMVVKTDKPAFFVSIYCDDTVLSNNGINILPGEENIIRIENAGKIKAPVKIFTLNDYAK